MTVTRRITHNGIIQKNNILQPNKYAFFAKTFQYIHKFKVDEDYLSFFLSTTFPQQIDKARIPYTFPVHHPYDQR